MKTLMRVVMAYLLVSLSYAWFIWSASSHRPVEVVSRYLPGWVATLIWASWLFFLPIMGGVFNVAEALRISLAVLFLISSSLLPIACRFYPGTTVLVGAGLFIEGLWLVPQWKKWKRSKEPR